MATNNQVLTCINCPVGCRMTVTLEDGKVVNVTDFSCKRGDTYARQESVEPRRMVTAVARVEGSKVPVSLKTEQPIPKAKIAECMREVNRLHLRLPILEGDVLLENCAGTGINLVATRTLV